MIDVEGIDSEDTAAGSGNQRYNLGDLAGTYPSAGGGVVPSNPKQVSNTEGFFNFGPDALKKERDTYKDKEREINYGRSSDLLERTIDKYDNEATRLRMDPYYKNNHAKANWRGNLNDRNFETTLNLSRAADRLNNKRHWVPGDIGASTTMYGSSGINLPHSERWEPIDTQEMRQMRANEGIDMSQRQGDVGRSNQVLGNNIQMQQRLQNDISDIAKLIGTSDIQVDTALRNALNSINVNLPANTLATQVISRFNQELQFESRSRIIQALCDAYNKHGDLFGKVVSEFLSGASGYDRNTAYMEELQKQLYMEGYSFAETQNALGLAARETALSQIAALLFGKIK